MIQKLSLLLFCSLPLFADFFPKSIHTKVTSISHDTIKLQNTFPVKGMSGVVIHPYAKSVAAITSYVVQNSKSEVKLLKTSLLEHDKIPTINTKVKKGDKVIGGYLYDNVLLLAPDVKTYQHITTTEYKNWIHPDLFAVYLSSIGDEKATRENLKSFAKKYQVGLVYIVRKNSAVLLDPISSKILSKKSMQHLPKEGKYPFYMRLDEIKSSWFSFSKKKRDYYQAMERL